MHYLILWLVLSVSSLGSCLVAFGAHTFRILQSSDTGWIIRAGQYIISEGKLPVHDVFSWTCTGCNWILYQWLFECATAALFIAGGLWLVGLFSCIVLAVVFLYLLPRQWLMLGIPAFISFAFVGLALTPHCFFARPQLVSYVCLAVFAGILERARTTGESRRLWLLPPLMVLGVNCHSFWFIGLTMIAAYCLDGWLSVFKRGIAGADRRQQMILTQVLAVAAVCVLANPYGANLVAYQFSFLQDPDFARIHELRPIFAVPYEANLPFIVYLAASWALVIWRRRTVPSAGLWLMAAASLAALLMRRFAPVAAVVCWPFLGLALADLRSLWQRLPAPIDAQPMVLSPRVEHLWRRLTDSGARLHCLVHLALVIAVAVAMWLWSFPHPGRTWFTHAGDRREGIEFLKALHLGPRIFNDGTGGSNMIFAGCLPVFIDTRFDLYGKEFCQAWQSCMDAEPGWQQYLERRDITHIFIGRYSPLHTALKRSKHWLCVYLDGACAIWVRKEPM